MIKKIKNTTFYNFFAGYKKYHFLVNLKNGAEVLDVGCGNHSPKAFKRINARIRYTGVDIAEYNLDDDDYELAERIVFLDKNNFAMELKQQGKFDAVVSAHNLEHTSEPMKVIEAMMFVLKKGGLLYLAFPTEKSASFPSRKGTLNFYDDSTHHTLPSFCKVINEIEANEGKIIYKRKCYRTVLGFIKGLLQEPFSAISKKKYSHTWQLYGFETVIIAEKKN